MKLFRPPAIAGLLLATGTNLACAAWHDEHAGDEVRAHHVHLSGHSADNESARQRLLQERQACADINASLGNPVVPLPAEGIPAIVHHEEVDIYYAEGRTATVTSQRLYTLNRANCAIEAGDTQLLHLYGRNVGETCTVDLIKRRANGLCLSENDKGQWQNAAESPGVDLSKVPPHLRDDAQRALAQISKRKRHTPMNGSLPATGEYRTIAGYKCRVLRHPALAVEKCIASPESAFPIPPSKFNMEAPGILLYATIGEQVPTITADEVQLDIELSASAFAVPDDIRHATGKR